jgi:DeoR family transcriptional regulator, aga operon transcriptional repressor
VGLIASSFSTQPRWQVMGNSNNHRLLAEGRRRKILELIERSGQVTIHELVKCFAVSSVTVRSDLDALFAKGALLRSHGGAVRYQPAQDYPLQLKATLHRSEKSRIGVAAAKLIQPNQTVILDSGTTTAEIAKELKRARQKITVITSALNIANELADAPDISLIMLGGLLRTLSSSFVGPQTEAVLRDLHADHLFLAVDGFTLEHGPFTPDPLEAQLNALMMKVAREVTIVADSTKLGRRSLFRIGPLESVHRLITDAHAPKDFTDSLRQKGIDVMQV